jgi:anaerobic selenocysteine-containing dehydrogenase
MWEKIPLCDSSADSLCIVSVDNFLSPTPRWSDYVLPAATTWEQPTVIKPFHGSNLYIPTVTTPPGESKSQFELAREFLKTYEAISGKTDLAKTYSWGRDGMTVEERVRENFEKVADSATSPFRGKSWNEFVANPYVPAIPDEKKKTMASPNAKMRSDLDAYLAGPMDKPFTSSVDGKGVYVVTYHSAEGVESPCQGSYGNDYPRYTLPSKTLPEAKTGAPSPSGRFHVYSGLYVWQYEWKFSKWHGHLPADQRGQKNRDLEGDPIVYPIPMYFAYEDYFMEAYGGKPEDLFKKYGSFKPLLMTTTHNRFRSHSTLAEVGYLRELSHRTVKGTTSNTDGMHTVIDGGLYSGNDWGEYGLSSPLAGDMQSSAGGTIPRLNKAIQEKQENATYSEFWINVDDAAERGIEDGDLLLVQNPVGAVRVVARVTNRAAKGYCDLHQGCWYDPDENGVDDGGNCNTLMAQKHSYIDHGNGQQSAMVSVTKVK